MRFKKYLLAGALAAAVAANAAPYPHGGTPAAADLGALTASDRSAPMSVTIALKLNHPQQLEQLLESLYTQGSPRYHQFLSAQEFRDQFGPSADTIASVTRYFEAAGLKVTRSATAQLRVTGSADAIERAGFVDQRYQRLRADGVEFFLFQDARHEFAGVAMAIFHRINKRERNFAFFEIAQHRLAQLLRGRGEIKEVIYQLERQACVAAVLGQSQFVGALETAKDCAEAGAASEQTSCLVRRQLNRVVFGDIHATDLCELQEFAFDHFLGEVDEHVENSEIPFFQGHLKRLHVQPVAGQNAAMIAPAGVGRRAAPARVGAVDDVIVDQRRAVEKFDDGSELDSAGSAVSSVARGEKQQRGAQALSAAAQQIGSDFGDGLEGGGALSRQFVFHEHEVISDEIENLPGCEQRDGLPPGLHEQRCACEAHSILCDREGVNLIKST